MTGTNAPSPQSPPPNPQQQAGIHRRLIQGIAGKAVGTVIILGEQILLVPVFLLFLSPTEYGDWLVLLSTAGFIGLFRVELNFSFVVAGIIYHVILYYVVGFFIRTQTKCSSRQPRARALNY